MIKLIAFSVTVNMFPSKYKTYLSKLVYYRF